MYHIASIKTNVFEDFENSLWLEKDRIKNFINLIETNNLQQSNNKTHIIIHT